MNPPDLKYSKEHEWVRMEADGVAVIGLTDYAAENLGDVVFLELPDESSEIAQFAKLGEVESVKAVSDISSPIGGRVVERNEAVIASPELVNDSPYGTGWLVKIEPGDATELEALMTAEEYAAFVESDQGQAT